MPDTRKMKPNDNHKKRKNISRNNKCSCVRIDNLGRDVYEPQIHSAMTDAMELSPHKIDSISIINRKNNVEERFAVVNFIGGDTAAECVEALNGRPLCSRLVSVAEMDVWDKKEHRKSKWIEVQYLPQSVTKLDILVALKGVCTGLPDGFVPGGLRIIHSPQPNGTISAKIDCTTPVFAKQLAQLMCMQMVRGQRVWAKWCQNDDMLETDDVCRGKGNEGLLNTVTFWNVHQNTTTRELFDFCWKFGVVQDARVDRERRIATVDMQDGASAVRVWKNGNGKKIHNIAVTTALQHESHVLVIQHVPRQITESDIFEYITSNCGPVLPQSIIIAGANDEEMNDRSAFVYFEDTADVTVCIWKLSGVPMEPVGEEDVVAIESRKKMDLVTGSDWIKVINIPVSVTEQGLLNHIQANGGITKPPKRIHISRHLRYRDLTARAMIQCQNDEDAASLVKHLRMVPIIGFGNKLWVEPWEHSMVLERKEHLLGTTNRVRLKNLHWSLCKRLEIDKLCGKYGTVVKCEIKEDVYGYGTGEVEITMMKSREASALWKKLHGQRKNHLVIVTELVPSAVEDDEKNGKAGKKKISKRKDFKKLRQQSRNGLAMHKNNHKSSQGNGFRKANKGRVGKKFTKGKSSMRSKLFIKRS